MLTEVAEITQNFFCTAAVLIVILHMVELWIYNSSLKDYQKGFLLSIAAIFAFMTVPLEGIGALIKATICTIPILLNIIDLLNLDINEFNSPKAITWYKIIKASELMLIIIFWGGSILLAVH